MQYQTFTSTKPQYSGPSSGSTNLHNSGRKSSSRTPEKRVTFSPSVVASPLKKHTMIAHAVSIEAVNRSSDNEMFSQFTQDTADTLPLESSLKKPIEHMTTTSKVKELAYEITNIVGSQEFSDKGLFKFEQDPSKAWNLHYDRVKRKIVDSPNVVGARRLDLTKIGFTTEEVNRMLSRSPTRSDPSQREYSSEISPTHASKFDPEDNFIAMKKSNNSYSNHPAGSCRLRLDHIQDLVLTSRSNTSLKEDSGIFSDRSSSQLFAGYGRSVTNESKPGSQGISSEFIMNKKDIEKIGYDRFDYNYKQEEIQPQKEVDSEELSVIYEKIIQRFQDRNPIMSQSEYDGYCNSTLERTQYILNNDFKNYSKILGNSKGKETIRQETVHGKAHPSNLQYLWSLDDSQTPTQTIQFGSFSSTAARELTSTETDHKVSSSRGLRNKSFSALNEPNGAIILSSNNMIYNTTLSKKSSFLKPKQQEIATGVEIQLYEEDEEQIPYVPNSDYINSSPFHRGNESFRSLESQDPTEEIVAVKVTRHPGSNRGHVATSNSGMRSHIATSPQKQYNNASAEIHDHRVSSNGSKANETQQFPMVEGSTIIAKTAGHDFPVRKDIQSQNNITLSDSHTLTNIPSTRDSRDSPRALLKSSKFIQPLNTSNYSKQETPARKETSDQALKYQPSNIISYSVPETRQRAPSGQRQEQSVQGSSDSIRSPSKQIEITEAYPMETEKAHEKKNFEEKPIETAAPQNSLKPKKMNYFLVLECLRRFRKNLKTQYEKNKNEYSAYEKDREPPPVYHRNISDKLIAERDRQLMDQKLAFAKEHLYQYDDYNLDLFDFSHYKSDFDFKNLNIPAGAGEDLYPYLGPVTKPGVIFKQIAGKTTFHERYLVLRGFNLYWYRGAKDTKAKGLVKLPSKPIVESKIPGINKLCMTLSEGKTRALTFLLDQFGMDWKNLLANQIAYKYYLEYIQKEESQPDLNIIHYFNVKDTAKLDLSCLHVPDVKVLILSLESLPYHSNLKELKLTNIQLSLSVFEQLIKAINQKRNKLEVLELEYNQITSHYVPMLENYLMSESSLTLTKLSLAGNPLADRGIQLLAASLFGRFNKMNSREKISKLQLPLTALNLARTSMSDQGFFAMIGLFDNIHKALSNRDETASQDQLLSLNFSGNYISDNGLKAFVTLLADFQVVEAIDFSSNSRLTEESFKTLIKGLCKSYSCNKVNYMKNNIDEECLELMLEYLEDNFILKELKLSIPREAFGGLTKKYKMIMKYYRLV